MERSRSYCDSLDELTTETMIKNMTRLALYTRTIKREDIKLVLKEHSQALKYIIHESNRRLEDCFGLKIVDDQKQWFVVSLLPTQNASQELVLLQIAISMVYLNRDHCPKETMELYLDRLGEDSQQLQKWQKEGYLTQKDGHYSLGARARHEFPETKQFVLSVFDHYPQERLQRLERDIDRYTV